MDNRNTLALCGSMVVSAFLIGGGFLAGGVGPTLIHQHQAQAERSICWSPNVVTGINDLATEVAKPVFQQSFPDTLSADDQSKVSASFSAVLSNFGFVSTAPDSGVVHCNATIAYSYTRPDGSQATHNKGDVVTYTANYGQNGWESEMDGGGMIGVITYQPSEQGQNSGN